MTIEIYGAGLAGLIAGNLLRHRHSVKLFELQGSLPNNHSAVLRFRSPDMSNALGIDFKKVTVLKTTDRAYANELAAMLTYSERVTGQYRTDRSLPIVPELVTRYIAPANLIPMLASGLDISYDQDIADVIKLRSRHKGDHAPIISTIPMTAMIKAVMQHSHFPFEVQTFKYREGYNVRFNVAAMEAYASLYAPRDIVDAGRITITGDEIVAEYLRPPPEDIMYVIKHICHLLNIKFDDVLVKSIDVRRQKYVKISPIDDHWRKSVIAWLTDTFNIYSLGRFACWRPGLLLDDLINDVRQIERLMKSNAYDRRMPRNA